MRIAGMWIRAHKGNSLAGWLCKGRAAMADYYPILARAVSRLPNNNARARRELYERSRAIVVEQLRKNDPDDLASKTTHELAALDTAIRRVEAESPSSQTWPLTPSAPARPAINRAPIAQADAKTKAAAGYLAKILGVLEPNAARSGSLAISERSAGSGKQAQLPAAGASDVDAGGNWPMYVNEELGGAVNSLGAMLFSIAYISGAMAFTGVIYIRGLVWVENDVIAYPALLVATALVLCLLTVPPWVMFRRMSALSTNGILLRSIYSRSRRVF
jgi:hypothetical protein